jgi:5-methyltetrahydrofolate--homocysteine methyltransferase
MQTVLKGTGKTVTIERGQPTVIIGERINPTGRQRLAEALLNEDMDYVRREAIKQVEDGADIIDVNVGVAGGDEDRLLPMAVKAVSEAVDCPICIDSPHPTALPTALEICPGRPLINSVNGEEASLERVLPLVKEFNTAVIGLVMDDDGIPTTAEKRFAVAEKIVNRAAQLGIPAEDIIIDCLALTVGADHNAALVTLEAIRRVSTELGVNVTLGASNISFGLPDRESINTIFLGIAIQTGLTCAIVHPGRAKRGILITDLLLGRDEFGMNYIKFHRAQQKKAAAKT